MSRPVLVVVAIICIGCIGYLLLNPMERARLFLMRDIGKLLFPRLDPYQRQKKFSILAGTVLAIVLITGLVFYVFNSLGKR